MLWAKSASDACAFLCAILIVMTKVSDKTDNITLQHNESEEKSINLPAKEKNRAHLWKKGQSGNPAGRPRGIGLTDLLRHILEEEEGRTGKTKAELFLDSLQRDAVKGDPTARKLIMNYIDGLPKQSINVVHHIPKNIVDAIRAARLASSTVEARIIDDALKNANGGVPAPLELSDGH